MLQTLLTPRRAAGAGVLLVALVIAGALAPVISFVNLPLGYNP